MGALASQQSWAIPTGLAQIDEALRGGLRPGTLTLVAGETGVGTTTFALALARNAAIRHDLRTQVISPESSTDELMVRLVSAEAGVLVDNLRKRSLEERDQRRLEAHRESLAAAPLQISADLAGATSVESLLDAARRSINGGAEFVVLDGFDTAEPHARVVLKELKRLAQSGCAAVAVTVKAHPCRVHVGVAPRLVDLVEYETAADLADVILTLHRPDQHDWESRRQGEAVVEIVKNRYGPNRRSTVGFQGIYARFSDLV